MQFMTVAFWLIVAFTLSLGLALALTPIVMKGAGWLRLFDSPDGGRRLHDHPVPRLGGVAVYLVAAAVASLLFIRVAPLFLPDGAPGDEQIRILAGVFLGSAILFLVGLVDDLRGLSAGVKFGAQILAASIVYFFGLRIGSIALGYGIGVPVGVLEIPLLFLWIVGLTNAYNFIDGLDGLAAGVAVIACATIAVVALALGNLFVILPVIALGGALLGFLPYNFPKGRIFLGDAGSLSIGFLLAVLSIEGAVNRAGAVLAVVPILAVSVPLLDTALAIVRRWLRHVPLSGADARHIHHRLLALGLTPKRTAGILWALATGMAGLGLLMALTAPFVATSIAMLGIVAVLVMLIYGTNVLAYNEFFVAGEVLMSAPSRVRRGISDQIYAMDLIAQINRTASLADVSKLLLEAAPQFGFLGMELSGPGVESELGRDRIYPVHWAWKLDYLVLTGVSQPPCFLSIWCSPRQSARQHGAERVARVLGPALQEWFDARQLAAAREKINQVFPILAKGQAQAG